MPERPKWRCFIFNLDAATAAAVALSLFWCVCCSSIWFLVEIKYSLNDACVCIVHWQPFHKIPVSFLIDVWKYPQMSFNPPFIRQPHSTDQPTDPISCPIFQFPAKRTQTGKWKQFDQTQSDNTFRRLKGLTKLYQLESWTSQSHLSLNWRLICRTHARHFM